MRFSWVDAKEFRYLSYFPWREAGVVHGFTGRDLDNGKTETELKNALWSDVFNDALSPRVFMVKQVHGTHVLEVTRSTHPDALVEADAILLRKDAGPAIAAIKTADCVPILIASGAERLAIHAGWRGLADGIIRKAVALLSNSHTALALIGPCAGAARYEVGREVIEAIGDTARYTNSTQNTYLLDLTQTALNQLRSTIPPVDVHNTAVCTISDINFHSYRRDKGAKGRNISFIASA